MFKGIFANIVKKTTTKTFTGLFLLYFLFLPNFTYAGYWGESFAAAQFTIIQEQLLETMRGAITGAFKQAVGQIMNTQITAMVGGSSGKGAMFITNWQTFLVTEPQQQANAYMNDFFSATTRGRNSYSNYRTAPSSYSQTLTSLTPQQESWFAQEGIVASANASLGEYSTSDANSNYYKYQTDIAKESINPGMPQMNLMDYVRGPSEVFQGGNWRGFNAFFTNPANNPFGYSLMAKEAYQNQLEQEQRKADIQAIAYQGFKAATGEGGVVKTPGTTIGQLVNKVQGFSFDSISSAQDWGQLISSGVSAAATMAINTAVQTGLNEVDTAIQGGFNTATGSINGAVGTNFNINAPSLANTYWNPSGSSNSAQFNRTPGAISTDSQLNLSNGSQVWGDMNFKNTGLGTGSKQSSFAPFDSINFQTSTAP